MDRSRIGLVIPAYNEAGTIYNVVKATLVYGQPIVINDNSSDATAELAKKAGAIVISHEENLGYDSALNTGFAEAYNRGYEIIITLDADGQHDPLLLTQFIHEINQGADLVLGVRNKKPRITEHIFSFYTTLAYGINDPLCGMKAYRRSVYKALGHFDSYSSIGTELMLFAIRNSFSFTEINFNVEDRADSPRFGSSLDANFKILKSLLSHTLKK